MAAEGATLRAALWAGPLPDPVAPARALADRIAAGSDYPPVRDGLRALAGHGLPLAPALGAALARWPWSIDLALVALAADEPDALDELAARVRHAGRRHAALARALWDRGRVDQALALLRRVDRGCETWAEDRACLAEMLWHLGRDPEAQAEADTLAPRLPPAAAARLRLTGAWLSGGGNGLAGALARTPLPDDPGLWAHLLHLWLTERDLPRARAALNRLASLRPPGSPETMLDRARLALDAEDAPAARAHLASLPAEAPADWPARRHILHLRTRIAEAEDAPDPAPLLAEATAHARAALRLVPGHAVLRGLWLGLRERRGDWDGLAQDLRDDPTPEARATLARLGWPRPESPAPPASPQVMAEHARRTGALWLEAGDPGAALAVVSGVVASGLVRARLAEIAAEAHLWLRRPERAGAVLAPALAARPAQMGLWLQLARARFLAGDFAAAEAALARFRRLKTRQTGHAPPPDLRDRITADALDSGHTLPASEPAEAARRRLGPALARHPGLAACWLARPGACPPFRPDPAAAIPRQGALYWQGPVPAPVARGVARWRAGLPGWQVTLFNATTARDWLAAHDPEGLAAFDRLDPPAARADLFRACWIARAGGLFVDSDEFPRDGIDGWLPGASAVMVLESGYGTVANNFLAAVPGLPLFAEFRARVLDRLAGVAQPYPWWDSGPAQLTAALAGALARRPRGWPGLRLLSQGEYCARITTNLPFPHKRGPDHWRAGRARGLPGGPRHGQIGHSGAPT